MANLLEWWARRSAWKRARIEARHLVKEAERILRRRAAKVPESVAAMVRHATDEVKTALKLREVDRLRRASTVLDDQLDKHLSFARKSAFREYAESIGVAVLIALLLRAFVIEAFQIPSGSMIPTLEVGDHIFVSKFAYGISIPFTTERLVDFGAPKRGDVIVFRYPRDLGTDYIKRVVGLPGEIVEVRHNEVYINGRPMPREHVGPYEYNELQPTTGLMEHHVCDRWEETLDGKRHVAIFEKAKNQQDWPPVSVPPGHVFVMGDNRDNSSDSRFWGTVSLELIKGKALVIWWSRGNSSGLWGLSSDFWNSIRWGRFFNVVR